MSIFGDLISTLFEKRYRNIFLTNSHDKSIIELSKRKLKLLQEVTEINEFISFLRQQQEDLLNVHE